MANELKREWIRALESLRFDVIRRDPLQAHKESGTHLAVDVTLDESGQIRMTVTRQAGEPKSARRTSRAGRVYQVFIEKNSVTLVNYSLRAGDDLGVVLSEMENEVTKVDGVQRLA